MMSWCTECLNSFFFALLFLFVFFSFSIVVKEFVKGAVIFKAGYKGGRIFGGVEKKFILPRLIGVSKILAKITKYMMGCEILGIFV